MVHLVRCFGEVHDDDLSWSSFRQHCWDFFDKLKQLGFTGLLVIGIRGRHGTGCPWWLVQLHVGWTKSAALWFWLMHACNSLPPLIDCNQMNFCCKFWFHSLYVNLFEWFWYLWPKMAYNIYMVPWGNFVQTGTFDSHACFETQFCHTGSTSTSSLWFVDTFDQSQTSIQHNYPC